LLIDIETDRPINRIPYNQQFETLRRRLSDDEFTAMVDHINDLIDAGGGQIATAGWLPGSDWSESPFELIYTKAARHDYERSALFFGQLVWYTIMHRPEQWGSGRYQKNGLDIGSRTYFRLNR